MRGFAAAEHVPFPTIVAAVRAVESGDVELAVVPIENSRQGTITDTVDMLIQDDGIAFRRDRAADRVRAPHGVTRADRSGVCIRSRSADHARAHRAALSNAEAVAIAMKTPRAAAIAPARAAEIYGAAIIERGIEDSRANKTRFVVLGHEGAAPTGRDKTSLALAVAHDRPGVVACCTNSGSLHKH
jgi:chorismate mutase/prephenate dehydratase